MSKNEVVECEEVVSEETKTNEDVKVDIREDLDDIVQLARFKEIKNKYGVRHPYIVTFFNGEEIEFADTDGLYDLIQSYRKCGMQGYIKFKKLVEEPKTNEDGVIDGKYICMKYIFEDGSTYRLFVKNPSSKKIIDNYYAFYKKQQAERK